MLADAVPLYRIRIRAPRLQLRLALPDELPRLGAAAAAGIHAPEERPYLARPGSTSWVLLEPRERARTVVLQQFEAIGAWRPDKWVLPLGVFVDDEPIGVQVVYAEHLRMPWSNPQRGDTDQRVNGDNTEAPPPQQREINSRLVHATKAGSVDSAKFFDPLLQAALLFVTLAPSFVIVGLYCTDTLTLIPERLTGMIARRKLIGSIRILRRARRIYGISSAEDKSLAKFIRRQKAAATRAVLGLCLPAIPIYFMWWWLDAVSGIRLGEYLVNLESGTSADQTAAWVGYFGLGAITFLVMVYTGPIGLLRAVKLIGKPHQHRLTWPPSIPNVRTGAHRDDRLAATIDIYRLCLLRSLLRSAIAASIILLLVFAVQTPSLTISPTGFDYTLAITLLIAVRLWIDHQFKRRLHALVLQL